MVTLCVCAPCGRRLEDITEYAESIGVFRVFGEAERDRLEGISSPKARALSLGGLIALYRLTETLCEEEKGLEISRVDGGKPYFSGNDKYSFSISHAGELSVAALTDVENIGVDLETLEQSRNIKGISDRFFNENEKSELSEAGFDIRTFYKLWTAKEARAKRSGEGLSRIFSDTAKKDVEEYISHYTLRQGEREYVMAICTSAKQSVEMLREDLNIEIYKFQERVEK
ncbi:MAG: 4'-phosphopantetheinyl transferase superfamily protein [Clostridia bacterium]|nr:4'-phosphopantetheinyl transferase superfamily protein [Clostridia bacterium]